MAAGAALNGADEAIWPALPVGVIGAGLAAIVTRDVASGAVRRQQATGSTERGRPDARGVTVIVVLARRRRSPASASCFEPFSLVVLVALIWLWFSRRRQAERKHEGLRVLR